MSPAAPGLTQPPAPAAPSRPVESTQSLFGPQPSGTPGLYSRSRTPAGKVPLAQRGWLLPAAAAVLVAGVLAGCAMGAFGLSSGGSRGTAPAAGRQAPLPGSVAEVPPPPSAEPSTAPSLTSTPSATPKPQIPTAGTLRTASSQCLQIDRKDDGERPQGRDCTGSRQQRWQFTPAGNDQYLLINQASGKCLDVDNASKDDGAAVHQWACHNGDNQRWQLRRQGDSFALVNVNSGKCMSADDGLKQRNCDDRESQRWAVDG